MKFIDKTHRKLNMTLALEKKCRYLNLIMATLMGCGTVTGNPGGGGNSSSLFIPFIDFSLPSELYEDAAETSLNLLRNTADLELNQTASRLDLRRNRPKRRPKPRIKNARDCRSPLDCLARRVTVNVESVEQILRQLEDDAIGEGAFEGKGPMGNIYGKVSSIEDATYRYEATICYDRQPLMYILWDDEGQKVEAYRSHKIAPLDVVQPEERLTKLIYREYEDRVEVEVSAQGLNYGHLDDLRDGPYLFENVKAIKRGDSEIKISFVGNWVEDLAVEAQEGDEYIVASITEDSKKFAAYVKAEEGCDFKVDDSIEYPYDREIAEKTWCFARDLASPEEYKAGNDSFYTILSSLDEIKMNPKSSLGTVSFPLKAKEYCEI